MSSFAAAAALAAPAAPALPLPYLAEAPRLSGGLADLLHLGSLVSGALHLLQGRQAIVVAQALIVDAEAQLDHAVDAARKLRGLVQVETRGQ